MQLKKKITLIKNLQPIIIPTNIDPKLGSCQKSISPLKTLAHIQGFHLWVKHKQSQAYCVVWYVQVLNLLVQYATLQ